eukprot:1207145-Rhodomonas_salina.1
MEYMSTEPPRLQELNLIARGLDPALPWEADSEDNVPPEQQLQMNDQLWMLQLRTSAAAWLQAERADDAVWLLMLAEYTQQVLWSE